MHDLDRLRQKLEQQLAIAAGWPMNKQIDDAVTPEFMTSLTAFRTFDELLSTTGLTKELFVALTDFERDAVVKAHTRYDDWCSLVRAAVAFQLSR